MHWFHYTLSRSFVAKLRMISPRILQTEVSMLLSAQHGQVWETNSDTAGEKKSNDFIVSGARIGGTDGARRAQQIRRRGSLNSPFVPTSRKGRKWIMGQSSVTYVAKREEDGRIFDLDWRHCVSFTHCGSVPFAERVRSDHMLVQKMLL